MLGESALKEVAMLDLDQHQYCLIMIDITLLFCLLQNAMDGRWSCVII